MFHNTQYTITLICWLLGGGSWQLQG